MGRWLVLPRAGAAAGVPAEGLRRSAAGLGALAGGALVAALALVFVRQMRSFHDPFFATWSEDAAQLLGTVWGRTWLLGLGGAAAVHLGFGLARTGSRVGWWGATVATLAMGAFPAFTGHASQEGPLRPLTLAADVVHVWAAGAWVGGIALMLALEARWRREGREGPERTEGPRSLLPALVPAFSPLAVSCVAALIVTGLVASWVHLGSLGALLTTPYGRLLAGKIALALGVFALGAINWKRLTPRLHEGEGSEALRRTAGWELALAHVVLVITAVLVVTEPPHH